MKYPKFLVLLAAMVTTVVAQAALPPNLDDLLESGRVDAAVSVLESSLGENPYDPVQLNNLAVARARKGDVYTALELLDRAQRLSPENSAIGDNRKQLREWLAARIGANTFRLAPQGRLPPQSLPDPPALWQSP